MRKTKLDKLDSKCVLNKKTMNELLGGDGFTLTICETTTEPCTEYVCGDIKRTGTNDNGDSLGEITLAAICV